MPDNRTVMIGTSGCYRSSRGPFFPDDLPARSHRPNARAGHPSNIRSRSRRPINRLARPMTYWSGKLAYHSVDMGH